MGVEMRRGALPVLGAVAGNPAPPPQSLQPLREGALSLGGLVFLTADRGGRWPTGRSLRNEVKWSMREMEWRGFQRINCGYTAESALIATSGAALTDGKQHSWLPWKHWAFYFIHTLL